MSITGGSIAYREAHANAVAVVLAELLMGQSCTADQLRAWAATIDDCNVSWLAYELTSDVPAWWIGHMFFVEQTWAVVAKAAGVEPDAFRPMRPMFYAAYDDECARRVREKFRLAEFVQ